MSDILLSVGLQKGAVGSTQIEQDLSAIINRISKNPPKVKVGLQVDQSAINHFKSQLTQIVNSVGLSQGAPITVNISGIGEITTKAGQAKKALDGVAKAGKEAADAIKTMNAKQSADSLTKINNLLMQLQSNYAKWTAAQAGSASAAYATYGDQIAALNALKLQVEANALSAEEFAIKLSQIKAQASDAAAAIKLMGEDHAATSVKRLIQGSEEYNTALAKVENLLAQVKRRQDEWTAAKTGTSSSAYTALASYQRELEQLIGKLLSGDMAADKFADAFSGIQAKVKAAEGTIRSAGENTKTLGDRLKGLAEKFGAWLSVSQVIMQAIRAIKQMVAAVREVDTAMTELKKVTNETDATYTRFLDNASSRAKKLGASIADVVTATADYARLGFSIDDASTLADTAIIYKNIGDGIEDITTASESIISTMQAFGIEASDAMSIVDRFNEVGNNFAISSAGIGEAMQRSAAAMASANNTIDETIALITAANTIVQNPESVGTTLKTVSMYLRAAKTEAEEAGESTEGMASSVSELRQEILDLTGQRVDIQIDEDTFKSTYQILQELSEIWDSLTDITQANLLEMIGGKRNSNVVSALLENFSVAEDALKSSMESAGSAMAENEKHLDSINGKIEIFKATFEELALNFINSDFIKGVVDFGTGLLNVLNAVAKLVDALGGLNTVLYVTVSMLAVSNYESILSFFAKLGGAVLGFIDKIGVFNTAFAQLKSKGVGSLNALSQALNTVGISASKVQLILTALVAIIGIAVSAYNKWKQAQEEARQEAINQAEVAAELSGEISDLTIQYITLSEAVQTDASAKESLIQTQDALIEKLGLEQYEIDRLIEKYGSLSDAILQASKQELQTAEIDLTAGVKAREDELMDAISWVQRDNREYDSAYIDMLGIGYYSGGSLFPTDADYAKMEKANADALAAFEALQKAGLLGAGSKQNGMGDFVLEFGFDIDSVEGMIATHEKLRQMLFVVDDAAGSNNQVYEHLYGLYKNIDEAVANYTNSVGALNSNLAQQYVIQGLIGKEVPTTKEGFDTYRQSVIDAAVASGEFIGNAEEIGSAIDSVLKSDASFAHFYTDMAEDAVTSVNGMKQKVLESLTKFPGDIQSKLDSLSDAELEFVFDLAVNQGVTSWDDIATKLATFDEAAWRAEQSWRAYTDQLATILENGDVSSISNEITTLADALVSLADGTLEAEDVVGLIEQFPELAEHVDFTAENFGNLEEGLRALIKSSPEEFIKTLQEFKETNNLTGKAADQIDALCAAVGGLSADAIRDVNGEFGVLAESIKAATAAQNELEAALAEDDWDTGYEGRVSAYGGFQEVLDAGEYGSKAYAAYKEYFGLIEKSPEQIKAWMESNKKYFTEGTDGVLAFLQTVESLSGSGGALEGIASFDAETGEFWYDINELGAFADALGWTEEMLQDFIYKYRMYCEEWESRSPADTMKELTNAGLISQIGNVDFGPTFASLKELQEYTGLGEQGVYDLIDSINELRAQEGLPNISLIGRDITEVTQTSITQWQNLGATAEEISALLIELANQDVKIQPNLYIDTESGPQIDVDALLAQAGVEDSETVHIEVDFTVDGAPAMAAVEATVEEVKAILGEDWEAKLTANTVDAETGLTTVQTLLNELPASTDVLLTDSTGTARSSLSTVINLLSTIERNKTKTVTIRYQTIGMPMFAEGTSGARRGPALLGDEYSPNGSPKPELVVSGNRAYLAGQSGPEIGYLNDGDVVYTADETKRILRGNILHKSIPAHGGGTAGGLFDTGGLSGGNYNFSGGSSGSTSSNNKGNKSGDDEESWFERQYKDHQHWLAMDQEGVDEYLKWLDEAYQKAYEEGIIDLDEYYQYQEEVYQGVQDQFKDHINDIDHEISLLEAGVGNSDEIINLSLQAMADIEAELAAARAAGLDENGDYIQWLEQQWLNYSENVTDMREQAETEAQSTIDNLVEYRVDMLKQEIQDQKDALSEQLDDLQDFYDKQRKMLQDQYDEEKYLEEQKEKRKSVTDIQSELAMLENDNSAWAQKRKLELQAELSEAEKDLNSFEKDHALDMTLDMLDEQQAAQEAQIQAEMDALDEKLNDPHALFNQALADITNNTEALYKEFIEYNRKHGTGNDQDIADMWEEAYIADLEYQDTHGGEHPDGIEIGNYTGYVVPENPTPPQPDPDTTPPEDDTPEEPEAPAAPQLTAEIKKKVAAAIWNGGYGWGNGSTRTNRLTEVFGAGNGIQDLVNKGVGKSGVSLTNEYTYANMRKKFKGYASGTANATPGWHQLFEGDLDEYVFTSSDGNRYRMFSGLGDKVLNGDATDFLYDFANSGGTVLTKMLADLFGQTNFGNISKPVQAIEIHSGDIIVQGNANERTVSEIRRAQRENLKFVITEFNKLNK